MTNLLQTKFNGLLWHCTRRFSAALASYKDLARVRGPKKYSTSQHSHIQGNFTKFCLGGTFDIVHLPPPRDTKWKSDRTLPWQNLQPFPQKTIT